jgi:hypothetical protein
LQIRHNAEELGDYFSDLYKWTEEIEEQDAYLSSVSTAKEFVNPDSDDECEREQAAPVRQVAPRSAKQWAEVEKGVETELSKFEAAEKREAEKAQRKKIVERRSLSHSRHSGQWLPGPSSVAERKARAGKQSRSAKRRSSAS